jgi:carboxymethylenebutenolidase
MYRCETVDVLGKPMPVLVFEPEGEGPHPGLVIAQHLPTAHAGLEKDPFQIDVGERYRAAGFACAMPFLFHWWPADAEMDVKRAEFRDDWTVADLSAAFELLGAMPGVDENRIGILGHCWGGRVAWLGACHEPRYKACVVFYGGRIKIPLADGAPAPITLAGNIRCPVLGIFGNDDQGPSPGDVDDYEQALQSNGVSFDFHRYDGAGHGFQDFNSPDRYRQEQSEDAWQKALAFFDQHLR